MYDPERKKKKVFPAWWGEGSQNKDQVNMLVLLKEALGISGTESPRAWGLDHPQARE